MQIVDPMRSEHQPTTDATIQRRLDETVAEIPSHGVVARIAMGDVAYPRSQQELRELGGFALLLVTAVSHDAAELPVQRVEVKIADKIAALPFVTSTKRTLSGRRAEVFGSFGVDAVFLIPMFVTRSNATVTAYLGGGQYPLKILTFPSSDDELTAGLDFNWDPFEPKLDGLRRLLDEELPVVGSSGLSSKR